VCPVNKEMDLANELRKMYLENRIPTSVQEDINHISQALKSGEVTMDDLQNKDAFVVDIINQAMSRIGK
jgi:hypothetical protein